MRQTSRKAPRPAVKSDPQCKAVYEWEDSWLDWNRESLTLAEVRRWVALACRAFRMPPPPVRQHAGNATTFALSDGSLISFNHVHKNPAIALHEAAHYICDRMFEGKKLHSHGPTWLGIYMLLLETARIAPKTALYATARAHGLRWRRPADGQVRRRLKTVRGPR